MTTKNSHNIDQKLPNYRIYDRTGGGVTHDIFAESLDDAIEQGREWIEDGDWSGRDDNEDYGAGRKYRTVVLDCCVREIVRVPDLRSITSLPAVIDAHVMPGDGPLRIMVECGPETKLSMIPGNLVDGSTPDEDGYYDAVFADLDLPTMIDDEATFDGDAHDCSGRYSDPLPMCAAITTDVSALAEHTDEHGHWWVSVTEMGRQFGAHSHGGTAMSYDEVCRCCGQYKTTLTPGAQRNSDEPTGIITITDRDESSTEGLKETHEDDGWLPEWLSEYLGCSPSTRMTKAQAEEYIREHSDDDDLDADDLEHAFAAIFDRRADDQDRAEGLWSHLNA